jgi:hypothetical protein
MRLTIAQFRFLPPVTAASKPAYQTKQTPSPTSPQTQPTPTCGASSDPTAPPPIWCIKPEPEALILLANFHAIVDCESQLSRETKSQTPPTSWPAADQARDKQRTGRCSWRAMGCEREPLPGNSHMWKAGQRLDDGGRPPIPGERKRKSTEIFLSLSPEETKRNHELCARFDEPGYSHAVATMAAKGFLAGARKAHNPGVSAIAAESGWRESSGR